MISYLAGRVIAADTVLVAGVGYAVACAKPLEVGAEIELWVHTAVRENDVSLYGFATQAERALFGCLIKVSGVGPRVALSLLTLGPAVVTAAISSQDAAVLAKAPGIGPSKAKALLTAVSVPAALLDEFAGDTPAPVPSPRLAGDDLLGAMLALGHPRETSERALTAAREAMPGGADPQVLRAALRNMAVGLVPAH